MNSVSSKTFDSYPALGVLAVTRGGARLRHRHDGREQVPAFLDAPDHRDCPAVGRRAWLACPGWSAVGAYTGDQSAGISAGNEAPARFHSRERRLRGPAWVFFDAGLRRRVCRRWWLARAGMTYLQISPGVFNLPAFVIVLCCWATRGRLSARSHWKCIGAICGHRFRSNDGTVG